MADTPQNSETAAREALVALRALAVDLNRAPAGEAKTEFANGNWSDKPHRVLYDLCKAVDETCALALRPASSPGEVRDAMVEAAAVDLALQHVEQTGPDALASYSWDQADSIWKGSFRKLARRVLTAALLSTTQTEADDGR